MEQKSVHRFIYKLESKRLKRAKWNLRLPIKEAMRTCPDSIVSLNESECLRFIDEICGCEDINERVRHIQKKIRFTKKHIFRPLVHTDRAYVAGRQTDNAKSKRQ